MSEHRAPVLAILDHPSLEPIGSGSAPAQPATHAPSAIRLADPLEPHLSVLDLGATRGDGVFETIGVNHGRPQAVDAHLRRFAASATALDLPAPDLAAWTEAITLVCQEFSAVAEAQLRIIYTRGVESAARPTGWAYGSVAPDFSHARTRGVSVCLVDRGYRHDTALVAPWLLAGAKTLSYAVNMAALRHAKSSGADDAIFVSSDGFVLEGATSTVIFRRGHELLTPGPGLPILDGTTQADAFSFSESIGLRTGVETVTPAQLAGADGIWLVSSIRLAAPVIALDGVPVMTDAGFSADLNAFLSRRTA